MASIEFIERECFEQLFGMGGGYVLGFTNREFQEFIYEKIQLDVYAKYHGLSKAKILRSIMAEYDDVTVGKLLLEFMRYMQAKRLVTDENRETFAECTKIGKRLIGKSIVTERAEQVTTVKQDKFVIDHDMLLKELVDISKHSDTPQSRGYALERYLRELFEAYNLEPRGSFKIAGEQIDGSFILHNEVYLLEAKWTNRKIDKGDLVIFNEKVSSKSGFTRGLFISYAGFTDEALSTFSNGRTVNIILMTVQDLSIALGRKLDLVTVLSSKVRVLAEEGDFNKSIFDL